VQSEIVSRWGNRTLPLILLQKGRFDEFRQEVTDINQRDQQGLTFFHHLLSGWRTWKKLENGRPDEFADRTEGEIKADLPGILERWNLLLDMGGDPFLPCELPSTTVVASYKSGKQKGQPKFWTGTDGIERKWKYNMAFPGETAMASLRRRIVPPRNDQKGFPEAVADALEAALRQNQAQRLPEVPAGRRTRMRS
jgi:hypothetical protein